MTRRDFIALSGSSLAFATIPNFLQAAAAPAAANGRTQFFYTDADIDRIRSNTRSKLLSDLYKTWKIDADTSIETTLASYRKTNDVVLDFRLVVEAITRNTLIQIVEPSDQRAERIIKGIEELLKSEEWDFLGNSSGEIIGIQRSSLATENLLFAREVLWDYIDSDLHGRMLANIAEKGCLPCYRTLQDMENWADATDWIFTPRHSNRYKIDMTRWPMILGGNNLRAHPSSALGIGALALEGFDDRSATWLEASQESLKHVMGLFNPDGSYFEGLSYTDYTLRTTFSFFDAYQRTRGPLEWLKNYPIAPIAEFVVTMMAGLNKDGTPDIVNFCDAKNTVNPCVPAWIARQTDSGLAQWAVENASRPYHFLDFLWYEPKRKSSSPSNDLKNVRNDLDWVITRTGWKKDDAVLAFRSGGPANHEHADRNTFLFKYNGERLLNDPFNAAYDWRQDGWPLRLTRGHNGVLINGKGSVYHEGEEGTNASLAYAAITDYQDHGNHIWWTSDATSAYRVENYHIYRVLRSVYYLKPEIIVVLDQIRFRYLPYDASLRYFPYNADEKAKLSIDVNQFSLARPDATLFGLAASNTSVELSQQKLDVDPKETGVYPCIQIDCPKTLEHQIVTVLAARKGSSPRNPGLSLTQGDKKTWKASVGSKSITIDASTREPSFR